MFCQIFLCVFMLKLTYAFPAGVHIGRGGEVGASWGGYSASAGLGGLVGGAGPRGGLHAEAGTPGGHYAAAGLGGSVNEGAGPQGVLYSTAGQQQPVAVAVPAAVGGASSQSSASASSSASSFGGNGVPIVNRPHGSFFDDIFNIPISTLGAVNQYLNNRRKVVAAPAVVAYPQVVQGSESGSKAASSSSASSSSASVSSSSSSSSSATATSGGSGVIDNNIYHGYQKNPPNYNDIFNIPISVLGAVNRFLNG